MRWLAIGLFLAGCSGNGSDSVGGPDSGTSGDADGDGFGQSEGDCDDDEANSFPGAPDAFGDDIDSNCDLVDGEDHDSDGYAGTASGGADCDDANNNINPLAND